MKRILITSFLIGTIIIGSLFLIAGHPIRLFDPAMPGAIGGTTPAAGTFTNLDADEGKFGATTRVTINDGANEDGITFGSLGTATKGIDFTNSGLSGGSDFLMYFTANIAWLADGDIKIPANRGIKGTSSGGIYWDGNNDLLISANTASGAILLNGGDQYGNRLRVSNTGPTILGDTVDLGKWAGDGVSNGSSTITGAGGAAHGLSLAAGDFVLINGGTTTADYGAYRIVSDDGTSVVVDRALSGSDTNLAVTFFKDVVYFGATDGTNGQRIMNYSHQDKPLQIGGDTLAATGHSLGSEDVLIGGALFEINAKSYFDDKVYLYNELLILADDTMFQIGASEDVRFYWDTNGANDDLFNLTFIESDGTNIPIMVISDRSWAPNGDATFDNIVLPTLAIMSDDAGDYVSFAMGDDNVIVLNTSDAVLADVDETKFSNKLQILINGATYYIMLTAS